MQDGKGRVLGKGATRTLKGFHVAFVTSSAGGTVSMLALLLVKFFTNLYGNDFPIDLSIFKIFNTVIIYVYFGIIVTSVLYSLFTPVKFFRLNWVIVKWTLLVIIFLFAWVRLGPAISGMTSLSDAGFHVTVSQEEYALHMKNALVFASIQTALLILIVFISTIKPWGGAEGTDRDQKKDHGKHCGGNRTRYFVFRRLVNRSTPHLPHHADREYRPFLTAGRELPWRGFCGELSV